MGLCVGHKDATKQIRHLVCYVGISVKLVTYFINPDELSDSTTNQ